jgi:hypothetical protein
MSARDAGGSQALHAQEALAEEIRAQKTHHEETAIDTAQREERPEVMAIDTPRETQHEETAIGTDEREARPEETAIGTAERVSFAEVVSRSVGVNSPAHAAARARRAANRGRARVTLSVIVPLHDGARCASEHIEHLAEEARTLVASCEILVIADARSRAEAAAIAGKFASTQARPEAPRRASDSVAIYALTHESGESAALRSAFRLARGSYVVTMPAAPIVAPGSLDRILSRLRAGEALVLGRRSPGADASTLPTPPIAQRLLARASGLPLSDLGCGVRGMTRVVAKELADGGDLARFLPFLAHRNGHAVTEVVVEPAAATNGARHRGSHLHGLHDLFAVVFLLRFARAPLRLFGSVGAVTALAGALIAAVVAADRILHHTPLARRPILVLAVLLIVVGVQTIALGILGELTVFARTRRHREYRVERVLR